jgi:hypothetical protein
MHEINSHTRRQELLGLARKQYQELRWRLNFLETIGSEEAQEPNDQQIVDWYENLWKPPLN